MSPAAHLAYYNGKVRHEEIHRDADEMSARIQQLTARGITVSTWDGPEDEEHRGEDS